MKSYEEAVYRAATDKYHDYMDGSFLPRADAGAVGMIAFLFELDIDNVWKDVQTAYEDMLREGSLNV